ncbi:MAG: J domain-containing protein [Bryobacteraceae bacterium]
MVTYYEELGLAASASTDAIHKAYRNLTRLVHPDSHTDNELRRLAECQMRRLNDVYEVLRDPEKRSRYDAVLIAGTPRALGPAKRAEARPGWRNAAWIVAASLCAIAIAWYAGGERMRDVRYAAVEAAAPRTQKAQPVAEPAVAKQAIRGSRRTATPQPADRLRQPLREPETQPTGQVASLPLAVANAAPASTPTLSEPPAAPSPAEPVPHLLIALPGIPLPAPPKPPSALTGTWFYVQPRKIPHSALYPPEFIEAVIGESDGSISGRYRARYRVGNRAISPNVSFEFAGRMGEKTIALPWTGDDGSQGEIHLRPVSPGVLEIRWMAHSLGGSMGLSAGTATLVRKSSH